MLRRAILFCSVVAAYGLWDALVFVFAPLLTGKLFNASIVTIRLPHRTSYIHLRRHSSDFSTFYQVFVERTYDVAELPQTRELLSQRAGDTLILDCGANIGCSAVWFSAHFPRAQVIAIEPESGNFATLQMNTRPFLNIIALNAALWNSDAVLQIQDASVEAWAFQVEAAAGAGASVLPGAISGITLQQLLARAQPNDTVIVKMDVEGAEGQVFLDAEQWIDKVDLLLIELHDWMLPWGGTSRRVLRALTSRPFDCIQHGETLLFFRDRVSRP